MKIAVCCVTWNRPIELGRMLSCYLAQDYADRELVILSDNGQYQGQSGDRWRLVNVPTRYPSLGDKRNACTALISEGVETIAVWDDDDLYLPWALSAAVAALHNAEWSRPSVVLHRHSDGTFRQYSTGGAYHAAWAYRVDAFRKAGGYPAMSCGEDYHFGRRLEAKRIRQADPITLGFPPAFVHSWGPNDSPHISRIASGRDHGQAAWARLGAVPILPSLLKAQPLPFNPDQMVIDPIIYPRPW